MNKNQKKDKYLKYKHAYFAGFKYTRRSGKLTSVPDFLEDALVLLTLEEAKQTQKDLKKFKIETEIMEL